MWQIPPFKNRLIVYFCIHHLCFMCHFYIYYVALKVHQAAIKGRGSSPSLAEVTKVIIHINVIG